MRIAVIIQARLSSKRCPGKVLREVNGKPLLAYLLDRLSVLGLECILATSDTPSDDPLVSFAAQYGVSVFRGSLDDVASRFLSVAEQEGHEAFVRISGDSPLLDPELVMRAMDRYKKGYYDLVTNVHPRSYPKGQSVELLRASVFKDVYQRLTEAEDREHVSSYYYRFPGQFKIDNFEYGKDLSGIQMSVDTEEDFAHFENYVLSSDYCPKASLQRLLHYFKE